MVAALCETTHYDLDLVLIFISNAVNKCCIMLLMILPALIKSGRGPYSLFSESLTGQVSLMAYLPSSLWVAQTKVQNGEKNVCNLNISD